MYQASTGCLDPVRTLDGQSAREDTDRVLDAIIAVHHHTHPLAFVREDRVGRAACQPSGDSRHRRRIKGHGMQECQE